MEFSGNSKRNSPELSGIRRENEYFKFQYNRGGVAENYPKSVNYIDEITYMCYNGCNKLDNTNLYSTLAICAQYYFPDMIA